MTNPAARETALWVRNTCLCFATQRAARTLARRFDRAFQRFGITNNQFSLMIRLSVGDEPAMALLASQIGMDRTTLTAALKALQTRGLAEVRSDEKDRRSKRPFLSPAGRETLAAALPVWRAEHAVLEQALAGHAEALRASLSEIAAISPAAEHEKRAKP